MADNNIVINWHALGFINIKQLKPNQNENYLNALHQHLYPGYC